MTLDANQILALAPDPASAKAGSQLAAARNWSNLGGSDGALWGECQGSGKAPYRTQIDLGGPAFKCTCPSRKFPCKHGLGLYLLRSAEPALFGHADEPAWVRDWLQNRQVRHEKKAAAATLPDAAAQARKREEKREDKVDAGLLELQTWLHDLAREGLASVRSHGQGFWDAIAARMADAQAAPLARRLRRAGSMLYQSGLRHAEALVANELASLYLLTQAWQRIDRLAGKRNPDPEWAQALELRRHAEGLGRTDRHRGEDDFHRGIGALGRRGDRRFGVGELEKQAALAEIANLAGDFRVSRLRDNGGL